MIPALVQYMTTDSREARCAAFLRTYAERVRTGTAASWEIPNTVAAMLEDIANVVERQAPMREALVNMVEHLCDSECSEHGCVAAKSARKLLEPQP